MLRKIGSALGPFVLCLAPAGARAVCLQAPDAPGPLLLQGTIVSCRSAVPEIQEGRT